MKRLITEDSNSVPKIFYDILKLQKRNNKETKPFVRLCEFYDDSDRDLFCILSSFNNDGDMLSFIESEIRNLGLG